MKTVKVITKEKSYDFPIIFFNESKMLTKYFEEYDILDLTEYDNEMIDKFFEYFYFMHNFLDKINKIEKYELLKNLFLFCDKYEFIKIYKKLFDDNFDFIVSNIDLLYIINSNIIVIKSDFYSDGEILCKIKKNINLNMLYNKNVFKLVCNNDMDVIIRYIKENKNLLNIINKHIKDDNIFESLFLSNCNLNNYLKIVDKNDQNLILKKLEKYLENDKQFEFYFKEYSNIINYIKIIENYYQKLVDKKNNFLMKIEKIMKKDENFESIFSGVFEVKLVNIIDYFNLIDRKDELLKILEKYLEKNKIEIRIDFNTGKSIYRYEIYLFQNKIKDIPNILTKNYFYEEYPNKKHLKTTTYYEIDKNINEVNNFIKYIENNY